MISKVPGTGASAPNAGERFRNVSFTDDALTVDLVDGRTISVPLVWYPRLLRATRRQRANWQIIGGYIIPWPDIDEDLSTEGLLHGAPAPRGALQTSFSAPSKSKTPKQPVAGGRRSAPREKPTKRPTPPRAARQKTTT